jgi:uncharacterized protein (TIGR03067 family)
MVRMLFLCGLILAATNAIADDKKDVPKELVPFQGTWVVTKLEEGGKEPATDYPKAKFTFTGDKFTIKVGMEKPEEGTITVDPKKDPAEIDITGGPKKEKTLMIYKFDKDGKLLLSYLSKQKSTRPKKFGEPESIQIFLEKVKE